MSLGDEFKDEIVYGTFYAVEIPGEGIINFPQDDYTEAELMAMLEVDEVNEVTGYFVEVLHEETGELQWHGPFSDEAEVMDYLEDLS